MNILVTAIGSMSAKCVIASLKKSGHNVIGTDIYPSLWHYESKLCDKVFRVPYSQSPKYPSYILSIAKINKVSHIIPLTDPEIDVLNLHREIFQKNNIILCMPSSNIINLVRDKYNLYNLFKSEKQINVPKTFLSKDFHISNKRFPYIAKLKNSRSSEGLIKCENKADISFVKNKENYIIQNYIKGNIVTVDIVRSEKTGEIAIIPRKELIRTTNGAGLVVKIFHDNKLSKIVSHICNKLNINGCINIEFINSSGRYYLIDINPRFSAGIAFSSRSGYNFVINHLACFGNGKIKKLGQYSPCVMAKIFKETTL